ncbi:transmembrane protein 87B-like [Amphiura filiformis]|uniref:transmembrane protein 87B-like n=1 Tax=Amphiura filiformis TaxID=82378 RepID=UPI003B2130F2
MHLQPCLDNTVHMYIRMLKLTLSIAGSIVVFLTQVFASGIGVLENGKFYSKRLTAVPGQDAYVGFTKNMYKGTNVYSQSFWREHMRCDYHDIMNKLVTPGYYYNDENRRIDVKFTISWLLKWYKCENYAYFEELAGDDVRLQQIFEQNSNKVTSKNVSCRYAEFNIQTHTTPYNGRYLFIIRIHIPWPQRDNNYGYTRNRYGYRTHGYRTHKVDSNKTSQQVTKAPPQIEVSGKVYVEMEYYHYPHWVGYLSRSQHPLLFFNGLMCGAYSTMAVVWLFLMGYTMCRDSGYPHRIQFWIFGAIILGLVDSVVMYRKFKRVYDRGISSFAVVVIAEWISCMKYSSTKMLLIVVSMGYGISSSSLGKSLHYIMIVGFSYFTVCLIEGCLSVSNISVRKHRIKNLKTRKTV